MRLQRDERPDERSSEPRGDRRDGPVGPCGPEVPSAPLDRLLAASVARRFYLGNQSKVEIAKEFDISRFKVARLLDAAVAHDIVRIDITVPAEIDAPLGQALAGRFGLRHAVVVNLMDGEGAEGGTARPAGPAGRHRVSRWLGTAAAQLLSATAEEGDVIGLDGSPEVDALSEAVNRLPPCDVVQLTGVHGPDLARDPAVAAVRRTAAAGGGGAFPLYVPFVLPDAATATVLRSQPAVAGTAHRFGRITRAVVGIGAWGAGLSTMYDALGDAERETYRASGACADVAGHVLDASGEVIRTELNARMICVSAAELRAVPELIGVSGGARGAEAIRAVLKSGLLTSVVTDTATARRLLWHDGADDTARTVSSPRTTE
ncbi:sugar-binding transcriptional regulator [Streptomyces sp. KMM 9044]|uniref:sugar-binding transcriptional regulator n=1 Tax=Streptomyces sp. KMM 9044 TaxID=2744474 RepID=UPI002150D011|nr:sugar-binding domain-containing protein [Streptomyces sp. KMM 9044]WAX77841.1 transcriptional regulator [Streptomyces sp. KMM 9044]